MVYINEFRRKPLKHHHSDTPIPPPFLGNESDQQLDEAVARAIFEIDAAPWGQGP